MTILDQSVTIGRSASSGGYGSKEWEASGHQLIEATSDDWQRETTYLENQGFRKGQAALLTERHRLVSLGATGSLPHTLRFQGELVMLNHLLGGSVKRGNKDATSKKTKYGFWATPGGPTVPMDISIGRSRDGSGIEGFRYFSCLPTGFEFSQPEEGVADFSVTYDAYKEEKGAIPSAMALLNPATGGDAALALRRGMCTFDQCSIYVKDYAASNAITNNSVIAAGNLLKGMTGFDISADLMMKTDRRYLRGTPNKDKPVRNGVPTFTGTLNGEFQKADQYDDFVSGQLVSIAIQWKENVPAAAGVSESTNAQTFTIFMPACRYTGSTPNASLDDVASISLPFISLYNGVDIVAASSAATAGANSPFQIDVDSFELALPS